MGNGESAHEGFVDAQKAVDRKLSITVDVQPTPIPDLWGEAPVRPRPPTTDYGLRTTHYAPRTTHHAYLRPPSGQYPNGRLSSCTHRPWAHGSARRVHFARQRR